MDMNARIALNPQPLPPSPIEVFVAGGVLNDLDSFHTLQKSILDKLGCGGCTSGYDIQWKKFNRFVVDEQLNIRDIAGPAFGG